MVRQAHLIVWRNEQMMFLRSSLISSTQLMGTQSMGTLNAGMKLGLDNEQAQLALRM
jgi:hypothetical protein